MTKMKIHVEALAQLWLRHPPSLGVVMRKMVSFLAVTPDGYIRRVLPSGLKLFEHRLIAEEVLGRALEIWECVHHMNGRRNDNRLENLCVMSRYYHKRYHAWYDWMKKTHGYPLRKTVLRKLTVDFQGIVLSEILAQRTG